MRRLILAALGVLAGTQLAFAADLVGLDHFAINVSNLQQSADWYQRVLGFQVLHKWTTTWMVGKDNIKVGLFLRPDAKPPADPDKENLIQHVAFLVDGDKFDGIVKEIQDKGIQIQGPEDTGIAYSIFFNDPDGILLEITTYHQVAPAQQQPSAAATTSGSHAR
jgi:catechol 2,3-dioxygenase-like lactoylglutathione lyase family enzyme